MFRKLILVGVVLGAFTSLGCGGSSPYGEITHINVGDTGYTKKTINNLPPSPSYIQTTSTYKAEFQALLKDVKSVSTENLLKKLTRTTIEYLNADKQFLYKHTKIENVRYFKVSMHFNNEKTPKVFIVNLNKQRLSHTEHYFNAPYTLSATCLSKAAPTCSVAAMIITKFKKQNNKDIEDGKVGFMYSKKVVDIDIKRANFHPEKASDTVKTIVAASGDKAAAQEKIALANGVTLSQVSFATGDGNEVQINNVISAIPYEDNPMTTIDRVIVIDSMGVEQKSGTATFIGHDSLPPSLQDDSDVESESSGNLAIRFKVAEGENGENLQIRTNDPHSIAVTSPNTNDNSPRIISPDVYKIDLRGKEGSNYYKQTMAFINYKNDPELDYHVKMLTEANNTKYLEYCSRLQKAKIKKACDINPNSQYCLKNKNNTYKVYQWRNSVKNFLNNTAAWQQYIAPIYETFDVSPFNFATTFVESAYSKNTDYKLEVGGDGEVGMFQFLYGTAVGVNPGNKFSLYPDRLDSWNDDDDRSYLVSATEISARLQQTIYKIFNNRSELMYLAYNMGNTGGPTAYACSNSEDPSNCKDSYKNSDLVKVAQCQTSKTVAEMNACFANLPKYLRIFNRTESFSNSLAQVRRFGMAPCTTIGNSYKIMSINKVTIKPSDYNFKIEPSEIDVKKMRLYKQ